MVSNVDEIKQRSTELLAGMLANPHIYPQSSIQSGNRQIEQQLIILATDLAETLMQHVEDKYAER